MTAAAYKEVIAASPRDRQDIDVTIFQDDLDETATIEELEILPNKKRRARLDAIRDTCRAFWAS
jgi:hypothetical protein